MKEIVKQFARNYVLDLEKQMYSGDELRSINNPVIFLFVGDKCLDALNAIYDLNEQKWKNSAGVLYFHVYTKETCHRKNVFSFQMPEPIVDKKVVRKAVYEHFYRDEKNVIELNQLLRLVSGRIAEYGNMYESFQSLNISVVTQIDDIYNVLLPEFTLLLKSIYSESFKNVQVELYALMKEKNSGGEFGFPSSLGVSFLKELDFCQSGTYQFNALLQITEDHIKLPVTHKSPLFGLVYILSDKNEKGIFTDKCMETNYEIICNLNLLKNKKLVTDYNEKNEIYNNSQFTRNIVSETGKNSYASAGYSKVTRPNYSIALTVLSHFYNRFLDSLKIDGQIDKKVVLEQLELDPVLIAKKVKSLLPDESKLDEMAGLMSNPVSYGDLKKMTMYEAEQVLFSDSAHSFFVMNMEQPAKRLFEDLQIDAMVYDNMVTKVIENTRFGLYCAYDLTSEKDIKKSIVDELRKMKKEAFHRLEETKAELNDLYDMQVDQQDFKKGGIFTRDKDRLKNFIRHLFVNVYGKKLEILGLTMEVQLLQQCESQLEKIHLQIRSQLEQMELLQNDLHSMALQSVNGAVDYLGKNIFEYYHVVVGQIVEDLASRWGASFYLEDRFLGKVSLMKQEVKMHLLQQLIQVCQKEIFSYPQFQLSFEDELLQRANVTVLYEYKEVLSPKELFQDLYQTLEGNAAIHVDVFNFAHKHRYEEKYFFGDFHSKFIRYAFDRDQGNRRYKLGCIHEKRSSGIEKLNMMGGFHIEDIMFFRNNKRYYDSYVENGFQFHGVNETQLSSI